MSTFTLTVSLALTFGPAASAADGGQTDRVEALEGVLRLLVADSVDGTVEHEAQILLVGDASYELTGEQGEPNRRVRVTGIRTGSRLAATSIEDLGPANDALLPVGTTRVLVMLGHWRAPDAVTTAQAANQVFVDGDAWYDDVSYGRLGQVGDVTPWMTIAGPVGGKCRGDSANTMAQAKAAAVALGYDLGDYDNYVLYSPNNAWQEGSDCDGSAAWAYVGTHDMWINGYLDRRVVVHEQGHNYGLSHSHSYLCDHVVYGSCVWADYGDDFDAMGASGHVGHFSASQKDRLGWMTGRTVDLTAGGSARLAPIAADRVSTGAAVVHASPQRSYWLEYRQPIEFDSALPAQATDGVLVHLEDSSVGGNAPSLLDMRPGDGSSAMSATMRSGQSWTSPEGFTIAVGSVTPSGAAITISAPAVTVPTVIKATPERGANGVRKLTVATATFSERVLGVSVTTLTITNARTGAFVPAVVVRGSKPNTWTIDPVLMLQPRTRYVVTLTGGPTAIRDLTGTPLTTTSWRFKTGH